MAKSQTLSEHQELRDRLDPPASELPEAPEGSADRVRNDEDLDFDSGSPIEDPGTGELMEEGEPRTVLVNYYDANGEAVAARVDVMPVAQPQMPGFEKPELWDRFEGRKVNKVILSFAGTCDLSQDPDLCRQLHLRNEVGIAIEGQVTGKAFKLRTDKNGVTTVDGVATINVTTVRGDGGRDVDAVAADLLDVNGRFVAGIEAFVEAWNGPSEQGEIEIALLTLKELAGLVDAPDDDEPSALDASLAEALA